ncbi:hypothetical protein BH23CHL5_BH23CHL5_27980 [soil metagenome]
MVAWDAAANRTVNTNAETILAYGAVLLRRLDIATRAMSFAQQYQDDETGGIFMAREETGPDGFQLLFPTAQYGMSALMAGNRTAAVRTGRWFEMLRNAQPELPERLYTVWTRRIGLVTEVPASENVNHFINDATRERQFHYNGGIAAAFLSQLFMATQDDRWLNLARRFQQFSMDSTADQFRTRQVCKSAWGAGLLYLATHDPIYLPWSERMGQWFLTCQDPDGGWSNTPYLDPQPSLAHRLETTAEFVVHLDTVIAALSAAASQNNGTHQD